MLRTRLFTLVFSISLIDSNYVTGDDNTEHPDDPKDFEVANNFTLEGEEYSFLGKEKILPTKIPLEVLKDFFNQRDTSKFVVSTNDTNNRRSFFNISPQNLLNEVITFVKKAFVPWGGQKPHTKIIISNNGNPNESSNTNSINGKNNNENKEAEHPNVTESEKTVPTIESNNIFPRNEKADNSTIGSNNNVGIKDEVTSKPISKFIESVTMISAIRPNDDRTKENGPVINPISNQTENVHVGSTIGSNDKTENQVRITNANDFDKMMDKITSMIKYNQWQVSRSILDLYVDINRSIQSVLDKYILKSDWNRNNVLEKVSEKPTKNSDELQFPARRNMPTETIGNRIKKITYNFSNNRVHNIVNNSQSSDRNHVESGTSSKPVQFNDDNVTRSNSKNHTRRTMEAVAPIDYRINVSDEFDSESDKLVKPNLLGLTKSKLNVTVLDKKFQQDPMDGILKVFNGALSTKNSSGLKSIQSHAVS